MEAETDVKKQDEKKPPKKEEVFIQHKLTREKLFPPRSENMQGYENWNKLYGPLYNV